MKMQNPRKTKKRETSLSHIRSRVSKWVYVRPKLENHDLCPAKYDMYAINERVYRTMSRVGKTRVDIATLYGMDASIPLALQLREKVPRPTMGKVVKLSGFLGVSVRWILHGEPENEVDIFVMGPHSCGTACMSVTGQAASQGGAIISGAKNSTVVVQNISGEELSSMERELIRTIRQLPPREQATVMSYVFTLEEQTKDKK